MNLTQTRLQALELGAIQPTGWLRAQLKIQATGLSGHLDEFWKDIAESGWIGGTGEGWERAPYWLDGLIPLAFLLDDDRLIAKAQFWVDKILELQDEDGWLGVREGGHAGIGEREMDPWPLFIVFKAFTQWQEATKDERIVPAMSKAMQKINSLLDEKPLSSWSKMRWQDLAISVIWLHKRTNEAWLLAFLNKIEAQGYDWEISFSDFQLKEKQSEWTLENHVVNHAMGLKEAAIRFQISGNDSEEAGAVRQIAALDTWHGQASGVFSGDESLAGLSPSQGTELCAVVEYLFSLERLMEAFGFVDFADRWEKIAFNALPAAFKPDMWAHQYVQQANQAVCKLSEERVYTNNGADSNLFGLEPNFGCCTANMHQGWPKFASHMWMQSNEWPGVAALSYAPCCVLVIINGVEVEIEVESNYPFEETVVITVRPEEPVEFDLNLRIPAWAEGATVKVQGRELSFESRSFGAIRKKWKGTTVLELSFPMALNMETRFNSAVSLSLGPLLFSLKIGEDWRKLKGEEPHADWEVFPTTPWNYALVFDEEGGIEMDVEETEVGDNPFSPEGAPIKITVPGIKLKNWELDKNAAAPPPEVPIADGTVVETLTLIPYGCTNLRITEFPTVVG